MGRREAVRRGLVRARTKSERKLARRGREERRKRRRGAVVTIQAVTRDKSGKRRRRGKRSSYIQTPTGQLVEIPESSVADYQREVAKAKEYETRFAKGTLGLGELTQYVGRAKAKELMQERLRSKQRVARKMAERVTPEWMGRSAIKDFQKSKRTQKVTYQHKGEDYTFTRKDYDKAMEESRKGVYRALPDPELTKLETKLPFLTKLERKTKELRQLREKKMYTRPTYKEGALLGILGALRGVKGVAETFYDPKQALKDLKNFAVTIAPKKLGGKGQIKQVATDLGKQFEIDPVGTVAE